MKNRSIQSRLRAGKRIFLILAVLLIAAISSGAIEPPTTSPPKQKEFNSPKEAADSLVQAAESFELAALKEILGPESVDIISSEDPVADKNRAIAFAAKAKEKMSLSPDPKNSARVIVTVGNDDFPMPISMVRKRRNGPL